MQVQVTLLGHSGFMVRTPEHVLIFDYWDKSDRNSPALQAGRVTPSALAALAGDSVIVFVSHGHGDHYSPSILAWRQHIPDIRYVFSDEIKAEGVISIGPNARLNQPDFSLSTLASTDEGVAFLVETEGLTLYHAGDLNWWHWEGEPEEDNRLMAKKYKEQIALLPPAIDLAFVPLDPRLEAQYSLGLDHLMATHKVRRAVPMHLWGGTGVVDRLLADPCSLAYRDRVVPLIRPGEHVTLEL